MTNEPSTALFQLNHHIRCELNDLARRRDEQPAAVELDEGRLPAPPPSGSVPTPDGRRVIEAIDHLPEENLKASAWCESRH
jgi:hypothetical protein